jgi:hypothetical protein
MFNYWRGARALAAGVNFITRCWINFFVAGLLAAIELWVSAQLTFYAVYLSLSGFILFSRLPFSEQCVFPFYACPN